MTKCPVCGNKVPVFISLLLLRRRFRCEKCGSRLKIKPSSVAPISIVGIFGIMLLGLAAGFGQQNFLLLVLLAWCLLFLILYASLAKLVIDE